MSIKKCKKCGNEKNIIEFRKWRNICKKCEYEYNKQYNENNIQRKQYGKEYNKKYWSYKKEELTKSHKKYYDENNDKILKQKKDYYKNHKEDRREYNKKYYDENTDKILNHNREYYQNNKEKVNKNRNKKDKQKRLKNPNFKILQLLRTRLIEAVKYQKTKKSEKTIKLLGCSIDFLKEHLQQTAFKNGYLDFDINNYSGKDYHIDHIIPCNAFNLQCSFHQKLCFNWSNLQILKSKDNLIKGKSIC